MDTNKMRDLKEFAEAATSGEWTCSDKHDGRFWHIQAGSQAIGATHAAGRKSPMAGVFEANARFIAAASPATVVALLSEIERLEHESQNLSNQVGECDRERRAFRAERDQLKAENEALRKDAERYRWLRDDEYLHAWADLHVCDEHRRAEVTDKAIDAAMAKEASHD